MENVQTIFPEWKNAVYVAVSEFNVGDIITIEWMHKNFKIDKPLHGSFDDFQRYQLRLLEYIDHFRSELLEEHNLAIANVRGEGYRILKPKEQTGYAELKFIREIKKSVKNAVSILNHINFDALDDAERKLNADTKARIAAVYSMSKRCKAIER